VITCIGSSIKAHTALHREAAPCFTACRHHRSPAPLVTIRTRTDNTHCFGPLGNLTCLLIRRIGTLIENGLDHFVLENVLHFGVASQSVGQIPASQLVTVQKRTENRTPTLQLRLSSHLLFVWYRSKRAPRSQRRVPHKGERAPLPDAFSNPLKQREAGKAHLCHQCAAPEL
jgi:hypothetical protein